MGLAGTRSRSLRARSMRRRVFERSCRSTSKAKATTTTWTPPFRFAARERTVARQASAAFSRDRQVSQGSCAGDAAYTADEVTALRRRVLACARVYDDGI